MDNKMIQTDLFNPRRSHQILRCAACNVVLHRNAPESPEDEANCLIEAKHLGIVWLFDRPACMDGFIKKYLNNPTASWFDVKVACGRAYPSYYMKSIAQRLFRLGDVKRDAN